MKIKALLLFCLFIFIRSAYADSQPKVVHLFLNGTIHAITAEYVAKGIDYAVQNKAELIILQLQTPGGVMESMRVIISKMINSPVPVVVYVAPSGSRATSAGFFIAIAADVAVMAPGTHLGSAHPVTIGQQGGGESENTKTMMKKATEDSVAYIKTLAERRGRNVALSEKAVRDSVSFTETEALKSDLIDFTASNIHELLRKANGITLRQFDGKQKKLSLNNPAIMKYEMSRREQFLAFLADPNVTVILITLGMLGLMLELYNPGLILPGIVGVICVALTMLSVQVLPINYAGLLLIIFAVILFVLELKVQSYGLLTIGGIVSMVLGSMMLVDSPIPEMRVAWKVIGAIVTMIAATMIFLLTLVITLHRTRPSTGVQGLLQEIGTAQTDIDQQGQVFVHGELWQATSPAKIHKGDRVKIVSVDGLTLTVEKFDDKGLTTQQ